MDDLAVRSAGALSAPRISAGPQPGQEDQQAAAQAAAQTPSPAPAGNAGAEAEPAQRVEAGAEASRGEDGTRGQLVDRFA